MAHHSHLVPSTQYAHAWRRPSRWPLRPPLMNPRLRLLAHEMRARLGISSTTTFPVIRAESQHPKPAQRVSSDQQSHQKLCRSSPRSHTAAHCHALPRVIPQTCATLWQVKHLSRQRTAMSRRLKTRTRTRRTMMRRRRRKQRTLLPKGKRGWPP